MLLFSFVSEYVRLCAKNVCICSRIRFTLTCQESALRLAHLRSWRQLVRGVHGLFHNLRALRKRLAEIHGNCQQITLQEFRDARWPAQEIHLLNEARA